MKWEHFGEGIDGDEFWASELRIFKHWCLEVHIGRDLKTGKFDFELLDQGRELIFRGGFETRKDAEHAMRMAALTILRTAVYRIERRLK